MILRSAAPWRQWIHPYNNKYNTGSALGRKLTLTYLIVDSMAKPVNLLLVILDEKFRWNASKKRKGTLVSQITALDRWCGAQRTRVMHLTPAPSLLHECRNPRQCG